MNLRERREQSKQIGRANADARFTQPASMYAMLADVGSPLAQIDRNLSTDLPSKEIVLSFALFVASSIAHMDALSSRQDLRTQSTSATSFIVLG